MANSPARIFRVHPLVTGVEAPGVADHRDLSRCALQPRHLLGAGKAVGERDLDLHVLARGKARGRLRRVHLRRRAQDRRVDVRQGEALREVGGDVRHAVLRRDLARLAELAADERNDLDAVDQANRVEVLDAERAGAGQNNADRAGHHGFSSTRWPTAVFDAGTW